MSRREASYASASRTTDTQVVSAGLTGMTDELDLGLLTHDGSSLVPPLYAGAGGGKGVRVADRSSVIPKTWRRPPWLYDGPLTDRVRLVSCNRCRRPVLEALADHVMPARVDLVRLTPGDELRCLVAGGMTLRLVPDDDGLAEFVTRRLLFRWDLHIRTQPGRGLPLHQCNRTWGDIDRSLIRTPARITHTEEPDF